MPTNESNNPDEPLNQEEAILQACRTALSMDIPYREIPFAIEKLIKLTRSQVNVINNVFYLLKSK